MQNEIEANANLSSLGKNQNSLENSVPFLSFFFNFDSMMSSLDFFFNCNSLHEMCGRCKRRNILANYREPNQKLEELNILFKKPISFKPIACHDVFSEKKIHLFSGQFSNATQETSWKA